MNSFETDILVVGGGPAGMAAALSAAENSGLRVSVVDDNPYLGGQIWRNELGRIKSKKADRLLEKIYSGRIDILNGITIFDRLDSNCLLGDATNGLFQIRFDNLIIAAGARERFLPFTNWTLPNVYGAGGLQALVKSGFSVENKRVVVSGTGPLLLAVAEYLSSKGATLLMILEQASRQKILGFGAGLWRHPGKLIEALKLRTKLSGIAYLPGAYIASAEGDEKLDAVNLVQRGSSRRVECDLLACGYHLIPNTELATLVGASIGNGRVTVGEFQETSVKQVFCAGESTGIGGVELSLIEGEIAGLAAVGKNELAKRLFRKRRRLQKFARALNKTFELRSELKSLPEKNTIVCRCEDVTFGKIEKYESFRQAKLQERCGMGACQGRICGSAAEFLFDWERNTVRPPIFPVTVSNLSGGSGERRN